MSDYPLSASQLKTFERCPRQYWYSYLTNYQPQSDGNEYTAVGSAVHEAIEEVLLEEPNLRSEPRLKSRFRAAYEETADPEAIGDLYDNGIDYVSVAARYLGTRTDLTIPDGGVEKRIKFKIDRSDIDSEVRSILDVASEDEILDWKTGKIRDDSKTKEQLQGATYALAFKHEKGYWPDSVRFVYLKEETVRTLEADPEHMERMLSQARRVQDAKRRGDFEAKPGDGCYWCGYELYCGASEAGVGQMDWANWRAL